MCRQAESYLVRIFTSPYQRSIYAIRKGDSLAIAREFTLKAVAETYYRPSQPTRCPLTNEGRRKLDSLLIERISRQDRYWLYQRENGIYYLQDKITGKQESLRTKNGIAAQRLLGSRNQAVEQPMLNRTMAKAYLSGQFGHQNELE